VDHALRLKKISMQSKLSYVFLLGVFSDIIDNNNLSSFLTCPEDRCVLLNFHGLKHMRIVSVRV